MAKYWTIDDLSQKIKWLSSKECPHDAQKKERLIRIAKEIKDYMKKEGIERIKVCPRDRDFGKKGFKIEAVS